MKYIGLILFAVLCSQGVFAEDLGFRYRDGKCLNSKNQEGYNPNYFGQCAELSGTTLGNFNFTGIDFSGSLLQNVNFGGSVLDEVNFTGANLEGANLGGVSANEAMFINASLAGTRLDNAKLGISRFENCNLKGASLKNTDLTFSELENINFTETLFDKTNFDQATIINVDFSKTTISNSSFSNAKIRDSKFVEISGKAIKFNRATLSNCDFSNSKLRGIGFSQAKLRNINFDRSNLSSGLFDNTEVSNCTFRETNLRGVKMLTAKMSKNNFKGASFSTSSEFPFTQETAISIGMVFYPLFEFSGIKQNLDPEMLDGWKLCYKDLYRDRKNFDEIMAPCDGEKILLACRRVGVTNLQVAAYANKADILKSDSSNNLNVQNNVGFYYSQDLSIGFAEPGKTVRRSSCDTDGQNEKTRICWHMDPGEIEGGWRCGDVTSLNGSSDYERLIYTSED